MYNLVRKFQKRTKKGALLSRYEEPSLKFEDCDQDTVESIYENIDCSQKSEAFEDGLTSKVELGHLKVQIIEEIKNFIFKAAGTDMKYFEKSTFLKSLVYKKKFTLI